MPIEYMINKTVIEHMNQPIKKKSVLHKLSTISIAMALTTSLTAVASYDYGPYLQSGSDTRIAVSWRTKNATNSKVCYGTSQSLGNCIDEDNDTDDHTVTLDGLTPNTKYYYSINGDDGEITNSKFNFVTSPTVGTSTPVRVWVIGDSGIEGSAGENVRDAYLADSSAHTDIMLMLGDNAYQKGKENDYQDAMFDQYADVLSQTVVWPVLGNHDEDLALYKDMFHLPKNAEAGGVASNSEQYYSFNYANIHFIALDSEHASRLTSGDMFEWLKDDLEQVTADWTIAYWHHSVYSKGKHDSDDSSGGQAEDMRERALPILEGAGVDLVLNGHDHTYQRSYLIDGHYDDANTFDQSDHLIDGGSGQSGYHKPTLGPAPHEGTVYIVTGTASKFSDGPYDFDHPVHYKNIDEVLGSVVIEIDGSTMEVKFIDDDGDTQDYFSIIKGSAGGDKTTQFFEIKHYKDDAEENINNGYMVFSSSDLEMSKDSSTQQLVGVRFREVNLPKDATIESATIQFTADEADSGNIDLIIHGHDKGDSDSFSSSIDGDISDRSKTSASVLWSPEDWDLAGRSGIAEQTPDLKGIVQELVNRSDWNNDSAITFIISRKGGDSTRVAESFNGEPSKAPKLTITWSD